MFALRTAGDFSAVSPCISPLSRRVSPLHPPLHLGSYTWLGPVDSRPPEAQTKWAWGERCLDAPHLFPKDLTLVCPPPFSLYLYLYL